MWSNARRVVRIDPWNRSETGGPGSGRAEEVLLEFLNRREVGEEVFAGPAERHGTVLLRELHARRPAR